MQSFRTLGAPPQAPSTHPRAPETSERAPATLGTLQNLPFDLLDHILTEAAHDNGLAGFAAANSATRRATLDFALRGQQTLGNRARVHVESRGAGRRPFSVERFAELERCAQVLTTLVPHEPVLKRDDLQVWIAQECHAMLTRSVMSEVDVDARDLQVLLDVPEQIWGAYASRDAALLLDHCHVASLPKGVGALTSLRRLSITQGYFQDLTPVKNLTGLEVLSLMDNNIAELTGGEKLASLRILDLRDNVLSSLAGIEHFVSLEELYIDSNDITDLTPLLQLQKLRVVRVDEGITIPHALAARRIEFQHDDASRSDDNIGGWND